MKVTAGKVVACMRTTLCMFALLAAGVATAGKNEDLAQLRAVKLQAEPAERHAVLLTRAAAYGQGVGGLVGAAIEASGDGEADAFAQLVERERIDPDAALSKHLERQLTERSILDVVDDEQAADATIRLQTIVTVTPWKRKYVLGLTAHVEVIDRRGRILWKRSEFTRGSKSIPTGELKQFTSDPALVRAHLEIAAAELARVFASRLYVART